MPRIQILNPKELLIINADDFGYNQHIDRGIIELLKKGKIKSVSVIINGYNIYGAVQMINKFKEEEEDKYMECSFGIHLNFTEGKPFNKQLQGTQFVENGQFIRKARLYELIDSIDDDIDDLLFQEVRLQILEFIKLFKRRPSHLDGHNHVHLIPRIAKVVSQVMKEMGIYRVRGLKQQLKTITIEMNHLFMKNYQLSKQIYYENLIISPKGFRGLQSFGNLRTQNVDESFQQQGSSSQEFKSVELMCHPGYPDENGIPWIANPDRLKQLNQLQSQDFAHLIQKQGLFSYLDLKYYTSSYVPKMLIYSKLERGTGNQTTTYRLKTIFEQLGFCVYLWNASDKLDRKTEASDLSKFLLNFGISFIVGVNAGRSAEIIYNSTLVVRVPYILIIAGTDANITFKNEDSLKRIDSALGGSQCLISLSYNMTQTTKEILNGLGINKQIYTIVQSTCFAQHLPHEQKIQIKFDRPYLIFPTSFRKVKGVCHLLEVLNNIISIFNIDVFIVGPILDELYYTTHCLPKMGHIQYLGVLSKPKYYQYLKHAFALINTSVSEGMSCSILEAFELGIPVIVRKNEGNEELVSHLENGLVYGEPKEFEELFGLLWKDEELRRKLVQKSLQLYREKYSYESQFQCYEKVINIEFKSRLFQYQSEHGWIRALNRDNIHPISLPNINLFSQIQPNLQINANILDLGCGSGIFSLMFLNQSIGTNCKLYLSDFKWEIATAALYNFRQSEVWSKVGEVVLVQSDLFEGLQKDKRYDVVLFNPPQTPFQNSESRLDKNGGPDAIKFYEPVLSYVANTTPSVLYLLHSFMAWPSKVQQFLETYKLQIAWSSGKEIHRIHEDAYNEMEPNLAGYLLEHIGKGRAEVQYHDGIFVVPAVVYRIESN